MRLLRTSTLAALSLAFAALALAPASFAGDECINAEFCEEPCPALTCESNADCTDGEICALSNVNCCATPSCFCDPDTGIWQCAGACGIGVQICVVPEETECVPVPALSGLGFAVLTVLTAAGMTASVLRRRSTE